jgi:mannonate dehydratase
MTGRYLFNRRHALCCGAAAVAGLFTSLQAHAALPGLDNPCRGALPPDLARHDLVLRAFDGLDPAALWDVHAHLLGTGDSGSGCTVHPSMSQWWRPIEVLRRQAILNAACVADDGSASVDRAYVERLLALTVDFPRGARWLLFAFDNAHGDDGAPQADATTFHVPDRYASAVAAAHADRFGFVASIHPYAPDALERLDSAVAAGALAVKWLPSAMNIDPRDARCRPYYDRLARSRLPLIVHFGEEQAVPGAGRDAFGNPLLARVPLEAGVRVVMAHCASLGHAADTDRPSAPRVPAFELFARLMDERAHDQLLLGDVSAVLQINRRTELARTLIERDDWHARLLHGSDYPLPGIPILTRPQRLADAGLLDAAAVPVLLRIREHNPLLFDFVLKRSVRAGARGLSAAVFDTRRHFTPPKVGITR